MDGSVTVCDDQITSGCQKNTPKKATSKNTNAQKTTAIEIGQANKRNGQVPSNIESGNTGCQTSALFPKSAGDAGLIDGLPEPESMNDAS